MIERLEAKVVFPIELEISEEAKPNKRPIKAVLFRAGVKSIAAPFGSDKPVVIDNGALRSLDLSVLVGLPLHATPNLDSHWVLVGDRKIYYPVGTITMATFKNGCVIGSGYLWDSDYPEIVDAIRQAAQLGELAVSWEISDVVMSDEGDYYRIHAFKPTGWALLKSEYAAYKSLMPAIAAIADKRTYDPTVQDTKVLLDDHRIMHAYYATLRRGGTINNWTLSEVVKFHAAIVDEMLRRHIQHKRGEGLSRKLNEESLQLQSIPIFTDEVSLSSVQEIVELDRETIKALLKAHERHEKFKASDLGVDIKAIPVGVPIAVSHDDKIHLVCVISKDSKFVVVCEKFNKPLPKSRIESEMNFIKSDLPIAVSVIESLPETIVIPGYIAVTGSSLLTQASNDLDLLVLDNGKFDKLASCFNTNKPVHVTLTTIPAGLAFPVYDLVLVKRVRSALHPIYEHPKLVEHKTVEVPNVRSFVAARMRSLGDLDIYPSSVFVSTTVPLKRGLLHVTESDAFIETDEDEVIDVGYLVQHRPESCLEATCEVWFVDGSEFPFAVADCLWWNATKVAELPFAWRLAFVDKFADRFVLPKINWSQIYDQDAIGAEKFVLQDPQAPYGVARLVVIKSQKPETEVQ